MEADLQAPSPAEAEIASPWEKRLVLAALFYFCARLLYFALRIDGAIPPDEITHLGRSGAFASSFLIPPDSPETYEHGVIAHQPFLFYWLMGRLLNLYPFESSALTYLRFANAAMGVATVVFGYRWMCMASRNPIARCLFVVLITNVVMFSGVSASVSYDNLVNLCAALSLYSLFAFLDSRSARQLGVFAASTLAGCLTKTAFLPLAAVLVALLAAHELPGLAKRGIRIASLRPSSWRDALVWGLAAAGALLTIQLYGGNLLRFGALEPSADQVVGAEQAMENRTFARNYIVEQYRQGEINLKMAVAIARAIEHPGDRDDTLSMLKLASQPEAIEASLMDHPMYALTWCYGMLQRSVAYTGHRSQTKAGLDLYPYLAILALAFIGFVRHWRWRDLHWSGAALIVATYLAVLMWWINYPVYAESGLFGLSLQGRYAFPVLVPLLAIVAHFSIAYLPRRAQLPIAAAIGAFVIYGDFVFFLTREL